MIKVICRTNIDEAQGQNWPEEMVCRPMIGDRVEALSRYTLKVVGITHRMYQPYSFSKIEGDPYPILEIELNH